MGKYDSPYYNSEKYLDPTAGAALMSAIRAQKAKRIAAEKTGIKTSVSPAEKERRTSDVFATEFAVFYSRFGARKDGKPKKLARRGEVRNLMRIYLYCTRHVDDPGFTAEGAAKALRLGSTKKIEQVFSGNGQIGKVIAAYEEWLQTGKFSWSTKDGVEWYKPVRGSGTR